jgi:hypothetical protein
MPRRHGAYARKVAEAVNHRCALSVSISCIFLLLEGTPRFFGRRCVGSRVTGVLPSRGRPLPCRFRLYLTRLALGVRTDRGLRKAIAALGAGEALKVTRVDLRFSPERSMHCRDWPLASP